MATAADQPSSWSRESVLLLSRAVWLPVAPLRQKPPVGGCQLDHHQLVVLVALGGSPPPPQ